jgi:hypothetical protein
MDGLNTQLPAVVDLRVAVTCDGEPVSGLGIDDFSLSEDGVVLNSTDVSATLLPLAIGYSHATIFAVDMTGDLAAGDELAAIQSGLRAYVADLDDSQLVAVWGFDGRSTPVVLSALSSNAAIIEAGISGLTGFVLVDSSRNLDGTVVFGLGALDARLGTERHLLGRLIVLTDGIDLADVVSAEEAEAAVADSDHGVRVVGYGGALDFPHLGALGSDGTGFVSTPEEIETQLDEVLESTERTLAARYVVAYCSDLRGGVHDLGLTHDGASASTSLNASAFEDGCSASDFYPPEWTDGDGDGYTEREGDCDDSDPDRYPGAIEVCNEIDDDCDGEIDEGGVCPSCEDEPPPPLISVNAGADQDADAGSAVCVESGYGYACAACEDMEFTLGSDASFVGIVDHTQWEIVSGDATIADDSAVVTTAVLHDPEAVEPEVCEVTEYAFRLTATSCDGDELSDVVQINLTCCGEAVD